MSHTTTTVSSDMVIQRIMQLIADRQLDQAGAMLDAVAAFAQQDPRFHTLQMMLAEARQQPEQALAAARTAVQKAPHWGPAQLDLALLLGRLGRHEEALVQARHALALAPGQLPVLQSLIDLAHQANDLPQAVQWLTQALALEPGHRLHLRLLAGDLSVMGDNAHAIPLFDQLVNSDATDEEALLGRAQALLAAGRLGESLRDWDALLLRQPGNATWQYHREVARGRTPATQPTGMVAEIFDQMAGTFDLHLVQRLQYQLPQQVAGLLLQWHPDRRASVLDLGCGTGLLGASLGALDGGLVGVDASARMLERAARHGVYAQLHHGSLMDVLETTPDARYQVVAALDVFIYLGALDAVIPAISRILAPGGRLVFSCEQALPQEPPWVLRPSGRYAHQQQAVEALCRAAGLEQIEVRQVDLRLQAGEAVKGFLLVARKPG